MTVSVCMCTYNGEKYIVPQLESIYAQTLTPDEVIICDDGSTDQTVSLVKSFIEEHDLKDTWKIYCNEVNKGYPGNFYYAGSLCTKEVVFLSDQDDVWHKEKIERMCEALTESGAKVCCCKFSLMDADGEIVHTAMAPTKSGESGNLRQVSVEDVFYKCEWPGMVLAYDNAWYQDHMKTVGIPKIPHDFLICAWAGEEKSFVQMDLELAFHRRHDANVGDEEHRLAKLLQKDRKVREIEKYLAILRGFSDDRLLLTEEGRKALAKKTVSMEDRLEALKSRKFSKVFQNARKHKGEIRPATLICDLLIVKKKDSDLNP